MFHINKGKLIILDNLNLLNRETEQIDKRLSALENKKVDLAGAIRKEIDYVSRLPINTRTRNYKNALTDIYQKITEFHERDGEIAAGTEKGKMPDIQNRVLLMIVDENEGKFTVNEVEKVLDNTRDLLYSLEFMIED